VSLGSERPDQRVVSEASDKLAIDESSPHARNEVEQQGSEYDCTIFRALPSAKRGCIVAPVDTREGASLIKCVEGVERRRRRLCDFNVDIPATLDSLIFSTVLGMEQCWCARKSRCSPDCTDSSDNQLATVNRVCHICASLTRTKVVKRFLELALPRTLREGSNGVNGWGVAHFWNDSDGARDFVITRLTVRRQERSLWVGPSDKLGNQGSTLNNSLPGRKVRFGAFEADLHSGELRKHGLKIKLQDQPFQVLVLLLERSGDVVTREELCQKLWPAEAFVDIDVGLNTAIKRLRDALGDSAVTPRFVETLPRRGYRFIARTEEVAGSPVGRKVVEPPAPGNGEPEGLSDSTESVAATSNIAQAKAERGWTKTTRGSYWFALGTGAVLLALFLGLNLREQRDRLVGRMDAGRIRSLAVLPLDNLSGDASQEYFADGMTDALITNLS